jgi:hypothetical protein
LGDRGAPRPWPAKLRTEHTGLATESAQ